MFVRAAFAKIFQLAHDDVFGRGERDGESVERITPRVPKSPRVKFIAAHDEAIRLQARVRVNDVELSAPSTEFCGDDVDGRTIKFGSGIRCGQSLHISRAQKDEDVDVVGEARYAVE